jgi:hypothetical protein
MYDFRNITISRKLNIVIDGQPYNYKARYSQARKIEIYSENADILIEGLIKLYEMDLNDCIQIEPLSVKFKDNFLKANEPLFNEAKLVITFKKVSQYRRLLNDFLENYKKDGYYFNELDDTLTIQLNQIQNFEVRDYVDIIEEKGSPAGFGFSMSDMDFVFKKFKKEDGEEEEIHSRRDLEEHVVLSESIIHKKEESKI